MSDAVPVESQKSREKTTSVPSQERPKRTLDAVIAAGDIQEKAIKDKLTAIPDVPGVDISLERKEIDTLARERRELSAAADDDLAAFWAQTRGAAQKDELDSTVPTNIDSPRTESSNVPEVQARRASIRRQVASALTAMALAIPFGVGGGTTAFASEGSAARPPAAMGEGREHIAVTDAITGPLLEKYARLFAADEKAGRLVHPEAVGVIADVTKNLVNQGYVLDGATIGAQSSDEAHKSDKKQENAGLGATNKENIKLAGKRETVFGGLLKSALEAKGITLPSITMTEPIENILTDKEIDEIKMMAEAVGLSNPYWLTEEYNREEHPKDFKPMTDTPLPPDVVKRLDHMLRDERKVTVALELHRNIPHFEPVPPQRKDIQLPPALLATLPDNPSYPQSHYFPAQTIRPQHVSQPDIIRQQPREHNMGKDANQPSRGGKIARSHGGDRQGKRVSR